MSQKNFTSHGHPIPGAPYRPDQQPRNVARCGGPGLCPDCSREAGHGNRKNRMTTIDYQQAAVEAAAGEIAPHAYDKELWRCTLADGRSMEQTALDAEDTAQAALSAAAPHLRAAWEQPIRELCEAAIKRANDPLAARGFYGEAFPATVYAQDILDLLEGGGEDK